VCGAIKNSENRGAQAISTGVFCRHHAALGTEQENETVANALERGVYAASPFDFGDYSIQKAHTLMFGHGSSINAALRYGFTASGRATAQLAAKSFASAPTPA
jgi:hypothetical protein